MFESNYTCHFFRLWGYEEGKKGIQLKGALLGNMQNDFDSKFGDICAEVNTRFFIIEFKTDREGFTQEVSSTGKTHRAHLYQHLREDSKCRKISKQGHFGAYANSGHQLIFEPYAHCPESSKILNDTVEMRQQWHELDYKCWSCNFSNFYKLIAAQDNKLCDSNDLAPGFFKYGLGITKNQLEEYVQCMYQHLESVKDDSGESILGAFSQKTGKFVVFNGTLSELIDRLHTFFQEMKSSLTDDLDNQPSVPSP